MTKTIDERLIEWHRENLGAALRLGYDSDPIFMDALLEIKDLRQAWASLNEQKLRCEERVTELMKAADKSSAFPLTEVGVCMTHGMWRRSSGTGCPACQGLVER